MGVLLLQMVDHDADKEDRVVGRAAMPGAWRVSALSFAGILTPAVQNSRGCFQIRRKSGTPEGITLRAYCTKTRGRLHSSEPSRLSESAGHDLNVDWVDLDQV
jgi:hypothetical protein